MACVRSSTLIFTPKLGTISPDNLDLINEIAMAKPYVISWSNVTDYMSPVVFHKIARSMSCGDTVHYMHSCNWTSQVMGTDIYDFNANVRLGAYAGGLLAIESFLPLLDGFRTQSVSHFRDICTVSLGRQFVNNYFRYFFENEDVNCNVLNGIPLKIPYPLGRCVSVAFILFAYKETGIVFGKDTYDFKSEDGSA